MTMSLTRGRKILLCIGSIVAIVIIVTVVQSKKLHESDYNGIPLPFSSPDNTLTGNVSFLYKRHGIDVYDVTYAAGETSEVLQENNIYLVHIPNAPEILNTPLDIAMIATTSLGSDVDYYGYRYSDQSATLEKRDVNAPRFKDRFPAAFFASAKALDHDASHGNNLHTFAQKNEIVFRPTDGSEGSVRLDGAGALYVFIVNEPLGARLFARSGGVCGNGLKEPNEECDDGDQNNNNTCSNVCTRNIPFPFDATNPTVSIVVQTVSLVGTVAAGDNDVSLMRFEVGTTDTATLNKVIVQAQIGTLDDAEQYKLVADIDHDGVVDTVLQSDVVPVDGRLTFDTLGESGLDVSSVATIAVEILADIVAVPTQESLQLKLASSADGYIQATAADVPLVGIMTDGECLIDVCDMTVETHPSVLLTITPAAPVVVCGDGVIGGPETCDDGDIDSGDGCSLTCTVEEGFSCNQESPTTCIAYVCTDTDGGVDYAVSGTKTQAVNGALSEYTDQCAVLSGVSSYSGVASCTGENCYVVEQSCAAYGTFNPVARCTDGCTEGACSGVVVCGDGVIGGPETCDDGDTDSGDGCSNVCEIESGYSCNGEPSICTLP